MFNQSLMDAITYATQKHEGQRRKVDETPYIAHPYRVAMLLKSYHCADHVVIAGLLHDIVEDTDGTFAELDHLFGKNVTQLVKYLTEENKTVDWEQRKQHSIAKIKHAPLEAKLIICADKIDNLQSMLDSEARLGESIWQAFDRGREHQQWYYQSMYQSVIYQQNSAQLHPLIQSYKTLLDQFLTK
ncbi:HD domain-containing protein [Amphibacillus sediminis]|uniref:HD domain-containing protein n=1 Tax=Amphibacillus sediminis TaxID=360185 RepID=UPI00082DAB52|nr:HD domain-containing protein [Amphibacillus sediminis]